MGKVLIVDDSVLDRKLLSRTLVKIGLKNEILQAEDGEAALQVIADHIGDIDLIFCDYQMPNISGPELIAALLKVPQTASIPVVMITASAADESRKTAYEANPNLAGYVIKPYKPDQLRDLMQPYVRIQS